ncbi:MAG: DsrE/DsrF/DrsH-like family protein, partial [Myxococcales bacterium]|nr:DsrE/DsrF/DrsH-like family protein [Myxococcales bacterium]
PAKASRATLVYGEGQSAAPRSTPGSAAASAPTLPASPLGFELAPRPETHALATREATRERPASERCTLLVLHNDHEALLAALLVANGAASQGMDTNVFFTFWGLNLLRGDTPNIMEPEERVGFLQRMMKWMMPRGPKRQPLGQMHFGGVGKGMLGSIMKRQNIMMLPDLMRTAQELGVRFTACTMSMSVM